MQKRRKKGGETRRKESGDHDGGGPQCPLAVLDTPQTILRKVFDESLFVSRKESVHERTTR
jgi:hypothetical protein